MVYGLTKSRQLVDIMHKGVGISYNDVMICGQSMTSHTCKTVHLSLLRENPQ